MPPPFYDYSPSDGLHVLKDQWTQKSFIGDQSGFLAEKLEEAIASTLQAAQLREADFRLDRSPTPREQMSESSKERQLEAAMLARWNSAEMRRISGAWDRLVGFQIPTYGEQAQGGFGEIDLVGVDGKAIPVIVELKKSPRASSDGGTESSETPLRMILEAGAYAISLRKNWAHFRREWCQRLVSLGYPKEFADQAPEKLTRVPLALVAPASFWMDWLPVTAKGQKVSNESWIHFGKLLKQLDKAELPVTFLSVSGCHHDANSLAVQPLKRFPLIAG